ncbi:MAG TPA: cobalt transporter CbiM [Anaerolineales bacterium]|nr:cobalt transporter CbiM [Anaerolineales bacterium]HRF50099.1 cobalt transporter CbiM [Anaerolineales bacterium]
MSTWMVALRRGGWTRLGVVYGLIAAWLATTAMHIPDGYLSPITAVILYALVIPFWYRGLQALRKQVNARSVPMMALMASFSFIIMMFNVPLPGGTTGHAVGATLAAILLGPDIGGLAVSIALIIQALFFGDGGITAIGANCFNMGVVMPYVAWWVYQAVGGNTPLTASRRVAAAAVAGWVAMTAGALITAIEFGVQPMFFTAADGTPLYAPYPLDVAIPAMIFPHMLVASVIEGAVTALVIAYLQRSNQAALQLNGAAPTGAAATGGLSYRALWIGLAALIVAAPLGLLAPGTAWGEWGSDEFADLGLSYVPTGLAQLEGVWGAPMADYEIGFLGNASAGYVLSAVLGIAIVVGLVWLLTAVLARRQTTTP